MSNITKINQLSYEGLCSSNLVALRQSLATCKYSFFDSMEEF